jgi:hypothetical protein
MAGVTATTRARERLGLLAAVLLTGGTIAFVPSWQGEWTEICHLAAVCAALTVGLMVVTQLVGDAGIAIEKTAAALFLTGMPLVYVIRWLEVGGSRNSTSWLGVELVGLLVYGVLALLGLKRSPWFLVVGIATHGIAWDAWHWLLGSPYVPTWYAVGCLICDLGLSGYLAMRVPAWRRARAMCCTMRSPTSITAASLPGGPMIWSERGMPPRKHPKGTASAVASATLPGIAYDWRVGIRNDPPCLGAGQAHVGATRRYPRSQSSLTAARKLWAFRSAETRSRNSVTRPSAMSDNIAAV